MIGKPADEVCFRCGAFVPHKRDKSRENYRSGMSKHEKVCLKEPQDEAASVRLVEISKQFAKIKSLLRQ